MAGMITCPTCGKLTDPRLDSCPHCGIRVQVNAAGTPTRAAAAQKETCPNCSALVQDGDIICVACGTNLLTGQKIVHEKKAAAPVAPKITPQILLVGLIVLLVIVVGVLGLVLVRLQSAALLPECPTYRLAAPTLPQLPAAAVYHPNQIEPAWAPESARVPYGPRHGALERGGSVNG